MPLRFQVQGGRPLSGTVRPAGNTNAALPILASTLLADGPVHLSNVPRIRDVQTMRHHVFASEQRYGTFGQVYLGVEPDFPVIAF